MKKLQEEMERVKKEEEEKMKVVDTEEVEEEKEKQAEAEEIPLIRSTGVTVSHNFFGGACAWCGNPQHYKRRLCGKSICGGSTEAKEHFFKSKEFRCQAGTPAVYYTIWGKNMDKCLKEFIASIKELKRLPPGHPCFQWPALSFPVDSEPRRSPDGGPRLVDTSSRGAGGAPVVPPAAGAASAGVLPPAVHGGTAMLVVAATRPPPAASDALASAVASAVGGGTRPTTASLERQTLSPSVRGGVFDELGTCQFVDGSTWGRNPGTSAGLHPMFTNAAAKASSPAGPTLASTRGTTAASDALASTVASVAVSEGAVSRPSSVCQIPAWHSL
ncbi:hypothetical protein CBR_g28906 [Chara braunii]|uniref:Uncharacterized protein n=1 Tax=Chara braunii TaxID=69332 RepID=A0A388LA51_CHABU|nr:hypothetical protein CBR_g28906 [Chara braunii]|eukprot:GBG79189.1 hypothetical protein CBR_g28906 [Chara braunii]